ncbi:MAG TPA: hypothetical protein VHV30_17515, partial [Polyangiaceae bacterium]|nr:hypothetical protein [Polyangiaceae bacterium]
MSAGRGTSLGCRLVLPAGALVAAFFAAPARGDTELDLGPEAGKHQAFASPQHFAAELRISPFTPNIDSDSSLAGKTPYADVFGSNPRIMIGAEFDWQALRIPHLGTLGPGVSAAFVTITDPATFKDGSGPSVETTSLSV